MATAQVQEPAILPTPLLEIRPFSSVAIKALQIVSNEYGQMRELGDLIASDAAFSAEILRLVNSPLFGLNKEIIGILQALLLLGIERVKSVTTTVGMKAYLGESMEVPALCACWRHSLACAVIAGKIAHVGLKDEDVCYTAGLMHDIGRLALAVAYHKKYADFLMSPGKEVRDILARERAKFSIDHCQAGRLLITRWNLPRHFAEIASRHHEPTSLGKLDVLSIVQHSCKIADALGFSVAQALQTHSYAELLEQIPERERVLLPPGPEELTFQIADRINSIETT